MTTKNDATQSFRDNLIRYGGDVYPEIIEKAQGCYVWDAAGKKILDFTSGQMCATVGHSHPNDRRGDQEELRHAHCTSSRE